MSFQLFMYIVCGWFENSIDEILNLCPSYVTNRTVTLPSQQVRNIRLSVLKKNLG